MEAFLIALALLTPAAGLAAQSATQPQQQRPTVIPARHLVMFTRAGPNFSKISEHVNEARAHQAIYVRLAADGFAVAGGAFEGEPVLGMTIWSEGIDEARARELIKDDELPKLGIVTYEFRTLGVRLGSLKK